MKIKYSNTLSDVVKFNEHWAENSPEIKKQISNTRILFFFLFLAVCAVVSFVLNDYIVLFAGTVGGLYSYFRYPKLYKRKFIKIAEKIYAEGNYSGIFCEHTIELTPEYLIEETESGTQKTKLSVIDKITKTEEHVFIFINSTSAHIIPKSNIVEGNLTEFTEALHKATGA